MSVHSFDFDVDSVRRTEELKRRYLSGYEGWRIQQGSILDADFVVALGLRRRIVGVLHHTGNAWKAFGKHDDVT